jgi:hypothetical protein
MKISDKERQILANFYDSPTYTIFKKHFLTDRQMELAQGAPFLRDMDLVTEYRGRIMELKEMDSKLASIYKKQEVKEKKNG